MKLADLDPGWAIPSMAEDGREGMGITFRCPHCHATCDVTYIGVWFANPIDGGPPAAAEHDPKPRWQRTGETFDNMSLTPSIDASNSGHWHGYIRNGEIA